MNTPQGGATTFSHDRTESGQSPCSVGGFTAIIASQPMRARVLRTVLVGTCLLSFTPLSHAEWTKDITCPAGTVYRDLREYAGREEFCEKLLSGSLRVKHGPYRFWYNVDLPGDRGNYTNGRRTGSWKECSRFGRCKQTDYPLIYPEEKNHAGVKAQVPIMFQNGKYRFDFASCWSTWVTLSGSEDIDFNIGSSGARCFVAYL